MHLLLSSHLPLSLSFLDTSQTLYSSTSKCYFINMMTSLTTGTDTLVEQWSMYNSSSDAIAYCMPPSHTYKHSPWHMIALKLFSFLLFSIFFPPNTYLFCTGAYRKRNVVKMILSCCERQCDAGANQLAISIVQVKWRENNDSMIFFVNFAQ